MNRDRQTTTKNKFQLGNGHTDTHTVTFGLLELLLCSLKLEWLSIIQQSSFPNYAVVLVSYILNILNT